MLVSKSRRYLSFMAGSAFYIWISVAVGLLILGCTSVERQNVPDNRYHEGDLYLASAENLLGFNAPLSIEMLDKELSLSHADDMAIDPVSKALFFITENRNIVKVSASRKFEWSINAHGEGPGEFLWPRVLKVRNGQLYIFDINQSKISVYSLEGKFIRDIVISHPVKAFEITAKGHIIIPNMYASANEGALFLIYNQGGQKIGQFGDNKIIQEDLRASDMIPMVMLSLSPKGRLVFTSTMVGKFYLFDLESRALRSTFSIQGGQEWKRSVEINSRMRGYPIRINKICFLKNEDMLVTSGGYFKDRVSIGMIFGKDGQFKGRLFGDGKLIHPPMAMALENDSTLWVSGLTQQLIRARLRPVKNSKKGKNSEI